ncbi:anhydro-N-acetylmuramic acid kinase [Alteromonas sp. 5E99-2]|uniref:anhydro-N-acetylmuramic acid kinase n=1 Tax=Alteromonas sp. 5E99-2 TaxID=2817683 RepID=UPI001A9821BA|nr:anhydro-N-acetylmuramic acid kinase [Alteromonas sp. 5E99-2]MBO1256561.1 anhydro-N-acetylmuramic acid kinase [Alteromonas sp. 5E99-2]
MTNWPESLYAISQKSSRLIIGLMSGTSLDGLDVALCRVSGYGENTRLSVEKSTIFAYTDEWKNKIQRIFAKSNVELQELCLLNAEIGTLHGEWVNKALLQWGIDSSRIDIVASHGQTVYHAPTSFHGQRQRPNSTFQIGDGDHLAAKTGILTVADFRQRHVANGGEGAPLVLYGDILLFSKHDASRLLINLGGIGNFTWLPKSEVGKSFATDFGPANTLLNQYCEYYLNQPFDDDGRLASQGEINGALLAKLLTHSFFSLSAPKTTGPELFNLAYVEQAKTDIGCPALSHEDTLATLVALTVESLFHTVKQQIGIAEIDEIYCSGGGVLNSCLMNSIKEVFLPVPIKPFQTLGVAASDKEAALFAVLANECVAGQGRVFNGLDNVINTSMGKICFPC